MPYAWLYIQNPLRGKNPPICQQLERRCGATCAPNEQQTLLLAVTSGGLCVDKTIPTHTPLSDWNSRAYKVRHGWQPVRDVDFNYFELAQHCRRGVFDMIQLIPHRRGGFPHLRRGREKTQNITFLVCLLMVFQWLCSKPHKEALGVHAALRRRRFLAIGGLTTMLTQVSQMETWNMSSCAQLG